MARKGQRWKAWSEEEDVKVHALYGLVDDEVLARDMKTPRSREALQRRAKYLGVSKLENRRENADRVLGALNQVRWWNDSEARLRRAG